MYICIYIYLYTHIYIGIKSVSQLMRRNSVQNILPSQKLQLKNEKNSNTNDKNDDNNKKIKSIENGINENNNEIDFSGNIKNNIHRRSISLNSNDKPNNNSTEKDGLLRISVSTDQSEEDLIKLRKKHKIGIKSDNSKNDRNEPEGGEGIENRGGEVS